MTVMHFQSFSRKRNINTLVTVTVKEVIIYPTNNKLTFASSVIAVYDNLKMC